VSEQARLFVVAVLPDGARSELARWTRHSLPAGGGLRRLDPASLHLTLCFLGQQPLACAGELAAVLGGLVEDIAAVGELVIGAPVWLPPRRPRALAIEIGDPDGGLRALQRSLARDLAATIDWQPGPQRFRPHVTVARLRPDGVRALALPPTPPLRFTCARVALLRSHLERDGARYEELASVGGW
jgi:2'-5' RNA ligase